MILVDRNELYCLLQSLHFSVNFASFEAGAQDLLADMQDEALELALLMYAEAEVAGDAEAGPTPEWRQG